MNDRARRWLIRGGLAIVLLVALAYGAIFFYANVINDSPDEFDNEDLSAAVNATGTTTEGADPTTTAPAPSTTSGDSAPAVPAPTTAATTGAGSDPTPPTATTTGGEDGRVDGTWNLTPASQFGYRVEEVVAGVNTTAVGRSNEIEGSLTIDGTTVMAANFTVDVASITSSEDRRDEQFRGRVMETDQFPTATFTLTEPIEFASAPAAGEQVEATATGDLTLHGVTRSVTFDVTAEAGSRRIGVLGSIPVLFADYEIDNPSSSVVTTEDNGLVEFILVFEQAA